MSIVQELQRLEEPQQTVTEEYQEEVLKVQPPSILLNQVCENKTKHSIIKKIFLFVLAGMVLFIALPLAAFAIRKTNQYDLL